MTKKYAKPPKHSYSSALEFRKDAEAIKHLGELVELERIPPERGGFEFTDWERQFIRDLNTQELPVFSATQRERLKLILQATDLRKRTGPEEKPANLFSKLSPERQAEQRARAAKVKLPWET